MIVLRNKRTDVTDEAESAAEQNMEPVPHSTSSPAGLPFREVLTSAALQAGWAPTKEWLVHEGRDEDLRIRVHRAFRALEQADSFEGDADDARGLDAALVFRWVALNALYGHWDRESGVPVRDRVAQDRFTSKIADIDEAGRLLAALDVLRDDARAILESPFLIERFWAADEWENVRLQHRWCTEARPSAAASTAPPPSPQPGSCASWLDRSSPSSSNGELR